MKWFKNLKIAAKLITGFFILAVIAGVVGIVGLRSIFEVNDGSKTLYEMYTMGVAYAGEASSDFQRLRYNALKIAAVESESEIEYCISNINDLRANIDGLLEKYKTVIINDEDRQIYEQAVQAWKEFMGHIDKAVEYSDIGQKDEVENIVLNECDESGKQLREIFDTMLDNNILYAGEMTEENEATTQSSVNVMVFVIGFAIALSIVLGVYISRIIGTPVRQMVRLADAIALGNVDVKVELDSKDEIGELARSFRKMIENIRNQAYAAQKVAAGDLTIDVPVNSAEDLLGNNLADMVRKNNEVLSGINAASEQVAIGSKQLSDSSIILSEGATEQASAIEELTASIEEISSQTELNAKNANQANELAEDVRRKYFNQVLNTFKSLESIT